jgi:hypothetical protein
MLLTAPQQYQVVQRDTNNRANIVISGRTGTNIGTHSIEARFNGGSWQTIASSIAEKTLFTGTLTNQSAGQGAIEVRYTDSLETSTVPYVGVGDVFLIAGQSNAAGAADNPQSFAHATLRAGLFGNDYLWRMLSDKTDDTNGQIDTVSQDVGLGYSVWPNVASWYLTNQALPVAFIPCALGGSPIEPWMPNGSHTNRASLYGSMNWRASTNVAGPVKAVVWWQGESNAISNTPTATYYSNLTLLASNIFTDMGVKLVVCKLQNCSGVTVLQQSNINQAIAWAWSSNSSVIAAGPDLSDIATDDTFHLRTDAKMRTAGARWWTALQAAFY